MRTWEWPRSRATTGIGTPEITAWLAKVCRRSWRRTPSRSADRRTLRQTDSSEERGTLGSSGAGNTQGPSRGCRMRIARAGLLRKTVRGPVLLSARWRTSSSTSDQRRAINSPLRQPVNRRSRMMSHCCRPEPRPWCDRSATYKRSISSRERNRVGRGRGFGRTLAAGFLGRHPSATAWFRICLSTSRARLAPPGAVAE